MLMLDEAVAKYKEARDWYEPKQSSRAATGIGRGMSYMNGRRGSDEANLGL